MDYAVSMHPTAALARPERRGAALGWGISLLVHLLAAAWLWQAWPQHAADTDAHPDKRIEIRLIPLVAKAPEARPAPISAAPAVHGARAAPHGATPPRHPAPAVVDTPAPAVPAATVPDVPTESPASAAGSSADIPSVDLAGARAAARTIAREDAKGLVTLPARKPVVDPNADHHVVDPIEHARRIDCQTARSQSTNLLANVVLLAVDLAKNAVDDSGCKWR